MENKIVIGTSGWSYRDPNGVFYPPKMKSAEYLSHYAKAFVSTEINSSFYHLPRLSTVKGWMDKVPETFKFCPKISKYLTHIKRLKDPEEPLERFFEVFDQMRDMMGPVLIQLPPSLKFDYELAEHFYDILKGYKGYTFALEVRHATWLSENSLSLMIKYNITLVISNSGVGFPYAETLTTKNIYVRFHGPGKLYASSYTDEMLESCARKFLEWKKKGHLIWVYFNNDWFHAIENATILKKLTGAA